MSSYTIKNVETFCAFLQEQVDAGTSVADGLQAFQDQQPKIPGEGEGVIVILNYGPKSHAIFGADTKPAKDGLMALNTEGKKDVVSFNGKLEFGAGWVVTNKTKLPAVLDFLDENEITYTKIERDAFVNGETAPAPKAKGKTKVAPAKAAKGKAAPAPKAKAPAKGKAPVKQAPKDEPEEEAEEVDLSSMKLPQLKALAKEAGLSVTGTKDELIERIEQHKAGGDEEAPEEDEGKTLSKMKTDDLKDILRDAELSTTGTKDVLIARILAHRKGNDVTPGKASKTKAPAKAKVAAKGKAKAAPKAKAPAKGKAAPKAKAEIAPVKVVAKKNDHGNFAEEETGLVFVEAPVGTGGRKAKIVVGVQDPESEETGIASLLPLDSDMIAECEERKWQYVTDDMMAIIAKKDSELHEQLVALQARGEGGGEDVPEGEEGEAVEEVADEEEVEEDEE
jgi:hypothetical protein